MADTIDNTILAAGTWVDLHVATGITVGLQVIVYNLGTSTVLLHTGLAQPLTTDGFIILKPGESLQNEVGASGVWAHSVFKRGLVNVGVI